MVNPIGTSLAGLQAAAKRIEVASNNLANQNSTATRRDGVTVDEPYRAQKAVQTTEGGVPKVTVQDATNPTQKVYSPDSPQADEYGFLNIPNVDQAQELVDFKIASYDYKANLKAIKMQDNLQQSLLDIFS